ncbi:hypothetical protein DSL72_008072 [Monilinia vaccinii-corymbosi]|uniref:Uncharacterized protein n=1 Tax=Monilinia vaccinii-corymbosi TaxID=61207 RepID=A0A8A3PJL9_9HELO|nr:hypothetical protein DSL72_008072 [Monilinia vaccinii-corymbosi]
MTLPIELEDVVGAALSQAADPKNETAEERAIRSWAAEMLLKKADGMLVEMMCPEILQNKKDLVDLFVCSTKLEKIGETIKNIQRCAAGSSNIEPQHQQQTTANAGGSKAIKTAGHGGSALTNVTKTNSEALTPQLQASSGETSGSRKKKKKKNNTVSEDATEALDPSAIVNKRDLFLPPLDYIPISAPIWIELRGYLTRLMNRGLKDGTIQMDPTTLKVKAICPLFVDEDPIQQV